MRLASFENRAADHSSGRGSTSVAPRCLSPCAVMVSVLAGSLSISSSNRNVVPEAAQSRVRFAVSNKNTESLGNVDLDSTRLLSANRAQTVGSKCPSTYALTRVGDDCAGGTQMLSTFAETKPAGSRSLTMSLQPATARVATVSVARPDRRTRRRIAVRRVSRMITMPRR